ncbi:hypothetical protein NPIL_519521 [Nephila pilipes]|uniref:Uncharacterized protein n=1 Tax=Nephila pilipes TaxID=299642 RepID=A0A8X6PLY8_NEPPI|nr:hypothetical protein NPIL_519521 [Nephila pilipes]
MPLPFPHCADVIYAEYFEECPCGKNLTTGTPSRNQRVSAAIAPEDAINSPKHRFPRGLMVGCLWVGYVEDGASVNRGTRTLIRITKKKVAKEKDRKLIQFSISKLKTLRLTTIRFRHLSGFDVFSLG